MEKNEEFYSELKELLNKYNASIMIEEVTDIRPYSASDYQIVVDFYWDVQTEKQTPQLIIGKYLDGEE